MDGEEDQSCMCRDTGIGFLAACTSPISPWAGCIMVRVLWVEGPIHRIQSYCVEGGVSSGENLEGLVQGVCGAVGIVAVLSKGCGEGVVGG